MENLEHTVITHTMRTDYPSPCLKCTRTKCFYTNCREWLKRYRYRQRQINAYARRLQEGAAAPRPANVFVYFHPDEVKRCLRSDPCESCLCRSFCETVCTRKAAWFSVRLQLLKRQIEEEEKRVDGDLR